MRRNSASLCLILAAASITWGENCYCFGFLATSRHPFRRRKSRDAKKLTRQALWSIDRTRRSTDVASDSLLSDDILHTNTKTKIAGSIAKSERRAQERSVSQRRELCNGCNRPPVQCVCASLPDKKIVTRHTNILILQHPAEFRRQTFSTVPLVSLVLSNIQVYVGHSFDLQIPPIQKAIEEDRQLLLLYPGPNAVDLNDPVALKRLLRPSEQELSANYYIDTAGQAPTFETGQAKKKKNLLILMDGTWTQALRLVSNSPELLDACQQVQFTSSNVTSIYDAVRKEPQAHCLSTLESIAQTLYFLESRYVAELASHHLHAALQSLVKIQLQYSSSSPRYNSRTKKGEQRKQRRLELEEKLFGHAAIATSGTTSETHKEMGCMAHQTEPTPIIHSQDLGPIPTTISTSPKRTVSIQLFQDGSTLRPLHPSDAPFIDSRWPHRSKKSLSMISRRLLLATIASNVTDKPNCCLGIYGPESENGCSSSTTAAYASGSVLPSSPSGLRAFILQYEDGSLGMLHVEEEHRRKGYASLLLQQATQQLADASRVRGEDADNRNGNISHATAFILDGNTASEALFTKHGWVRQDESCKKRKGTGKRRAKRKWIKELR